MDDFLKTVKAQLYERVTSPLVFSIGASWVLWNYRFVLIVFSSLPATDKFFAIEMLSSQYSSSPYYWFLFGGLFPVLSALVYLFLLPIPSRWVYQYVRSEQKKLKAIQAKIDDETPLTQEEARSLRGDLRKADRKLEELNSEYATLVTRLKQQVLELEAKNLELTRVAGSPAIIGPAETSLGLSTLEQQFLRAIGESDRGTKKGTLSDLAPNRPVVVVQHAVDGLMEKHLIERKWTNGAEHFFTTAAGRNWIVSNISSAPAAS